MTLLGPSHGPRSLGSSCRGFALLIVVSLLAFLVLLLVGLAAYTRIETAVAGNMQRQAQARENALLALNVAVGQLQAHAGPDQRVTATAEAFANRAGTTRYVGVWPTSSAADPDGNPLTPLTWLVSGNELRNPTSGDPNPLAVTPETPVTTANGIALVGTGTSGVANDVLARLMPITAIGVPGVDPRTTATIGRYAWWVGDNGVKADVARGDPANARLNYAPFSDVTEAHARLFQQTGLGAGPFNTANNTAPFDPRDTINQTVAANTLAAAQLAFLRTATGANVGLATVRSRFHQWTVGNHNVLARANPISGQSALRNDLSLTPDALGAAFKAWADYPSYLETPAADAVRRRYKMTPAVTDANGSQFSVAPVLSYVALAFSLRNNANTASSLTHLECSVRCVVGLWNPYTGALVPEAAGLQLFVTGLPTVLVRDGRPPLHTIDLQQLLGDPSLTGQPFKLLLPWTKSGLDDDRDAWLPGRVYNWSLASATTVPPDGATMDFSVRDLANGIGGLTFNAGSPLALSTSSTIGSSGYVARWTEITAPVTLKFELRRVADGATLATFESPPFNGFNSSNPTEVDNKLLDFAFVFRLADPSADGAAWIETAGGDPRLNTLPASLYIQPGNAVNPEQIVIGSNGANVTTIGASNPSLLLDRYPGAVGSPGGTSFNEDVPLFELPRAPLLSLGQLQHLALTTQRPFWIGQSAAAAGPPEWNNALFDQHFFSGLGSGAGWADPSLSLTTLFARPLPNLLLRPLRRRPDGTDVTTADFAPGSLSAKFLLSGGSFNLNSTDPVAWAAVLRSVRFPATPAGREFKFLDATDATGTAADISLATATGEAAFPRFSQSAQETFKTTSNYIQSEPGTTTSSTVLRTDYYRKGLRLLDAATVTALANNITTAIKARHAVSGPFISLEEFLNPAGGAGTPSLLEQAILDLNLNALDPANLTLGNMPFSSAFLTQADIMTALAPVLFPRSDTFTVRAYGEAVNPATNAVEGKAWCEAIVQRFPEPFSPATAAQPTDDEYRTPPGDFGRRFKIISFRWLTRSDI